MSTEQPINRRAVLASLWLVYLLNLVFRDIHEFAKAETLEKIMAGTISSFEPTQILFLIGGVLTATPISMVFFSHILPLKANRWTNMIVAVLMIAVVVTSTHTDIDDYFHAGVEVAALLGVIWLAWRWQPSLSLTHQSEKQLGSV